jgi:hypothetical protein
MISLKTKAFLQDSQTMNFKIPENMKLKTGEYEIVIVINDIPLKTDKKRKLTFSEHIYGFENPSNTFSREELYEDFGR